MNLRLDALIRRFVEEGELGSARTSAANSDARLSVRESADMQAVLSGNLRHLHDQGAHPLLIMQLAAALGIDPANQLRGQ